jgi:hypothetical protein
MLNYYFDWQDNEGYKEIEAENVKRQVEVEQIVKRTLR